MAENKPVKRLPISESGPLLTCKTVSGDEYIISQNPERKKFTLWHKIKGGYIKIAVSNLPFDLEDKIPWNK